MPIFNKLPFDLFVIGYVAIIICFCYLLGRKATKKLLFALYVSILTADAIVNLAWGVEGVRKFIFAFGNNPEYLAQCTKVGLLLVGMVVMGKFGKFDITPLSGHSLNRLLTSSWLGFCTAGLLGVSAITFGLGGGFIHPITTDTTQIISLSATIKTFEEIIKNSYIVSFIAQWPSFFFALPGVTIAWYSIRNNKE